MRETAHGATVSAASSQKKKNHLFIYLLFTSLCGTVFGKEIGDIYLFFRS